MSGALLDCALARWSPRIGDPSAMGWLTVAAYAAAALLAVAAAVRVPAAAPARRTERLFWMASAVALALLSVNKQLDLQSFLTAVGRCTAKAQGWYDDRRAMQRDVVLGLIGLCLAAGAVLLWRLRRTLRRTGPAAAGLVLIATFVLVRAVGFHHVDALIGLRVGGARVNWLLELGGLAVFTLGTLAALGRGPGRTAP